MDEGMTAKTALGYMFGRLKGGPPHEELQGVFAEVAELERRYGDWLGEHPLAGIPRED